MDKEAFVSKKVCMEFSEINHHQAVGLRITHSPENTPYKYIFYLIQNIPNFITACMFISFNKILYISVGCCTEFKRERKKFSKT